MWLIIKSEKKQIDFLKNGLGKRIGKDIKFYTPKIQIKTLKKKKIYAKEINLLGEYFFCFHKDFKDNNLLNSYKNIKGLKYILNGFQNSQTEISNFISKCKENENEKGFLKQTFFEFKLKKHYKFISGPFVNQIFQIIDLQKNKLNILIGKINTSIKKEEFLFQPI